MLQNFSGKPTLKWYQKGWGIVVLGFASLCTIILIFFIWNFFSFYQQIKQGKNFPQFSSALFTKSIEHATVVNLSTIDRKKLEEGEYPYLGSDNPKVVIVKFIDFKCPYCKAMVPAIDEVLKKYGHKIKLIIRHFPAESIHPGATEFAKISYCFQKQGQFWQIYYYFYSNQDSLPEKFTEADLKSLITKFNLNQFEFEKCIKDTQTAQAIDRDYAEGYKAGVEGTPTFFINGELVRGVIDFSVWDTFLKNN